MMDVKYSVLNYNLVRDGFSLDSQYKRIMWCMLVENVQQYIISKESGG